MNKTQKQDFLKFCTLDQLELMPEFDFQQTYQFMPHFVGNELLKCNEMRELIPTVEQLMTPKYKASIKPKTIEKSIAELSETSPNTAEFLELIASQVSFHCITNSEEPFRLLPTLLVGEPGSGKTYIANRIAESLNIYHDKIALSNATESFILSGCPRGYATTSPGEVVDKLAKSEVINPIMILDEIDKACFLRSDRPSIEAPLLQLLEVDTAKQFEDACLRATIDASHVSWIATANSLENIPDPILSRFQIIHIEALNESAQSDFIFRLLDKILLENCLEDLSVIISPALMKVLISMSIRAKKNALKLSIARQLSRNPSASFIELNKTDLFGRDHSVPEKNTIGFIQ